MDGLFGRFWGGWIGLKLKGALFRLFADVSFLGMEKKTTSFEFNRINAWFSHRSVLMQSLYANH